MDLIWGTTGKKMLSSLFAVAIVYWLVFLAISGYKQHPLGIYTQLPLVILPLMGGTLGLRRFVRGGGDGSLGGALLGPSLALILFGVAMGVWTYYLTQGVPLPYPSGADYVFVLSQPFWIYGFLRLSAQLSGPLGTKSVRDWLVGLLITVLVMAIGYYFLVTVAHGGKLNIPSRFGDAVFFDFAYTVGTLAMAAMAGLVWGFSQRYLGGRYREAMLMLSLGFAIHFWAVYFFVQGVANQTYFNGNLADGLFTLALYLEAMGVAGIKSRNVEIN